MPNRRRSPRRSDTDIAAVLIVRDEARCIERCLKSVKRHVDRIVVIDTGSVDDTAALAAKCGAEVHHMVWPEDFAAARNHALDLADADWNLIIDADEHVAQGGELIRRWCRGSARLGRVCVHSAVDGEHAHRGAARRNWMTRLLPRGVRYEGRVHEQAVSDLPRERIELHIAHDGYLGEQIARKRGRNTPLLLAELAAAPGDAYLLYQLGKDAEMHDDLAAASDWYAQALAATEGDANWRHGLVVRQMRALGKTARLDAAIALADGEMPNWPNSPDFFFVLGNLLLDKGIEDPANAVADWLPLAAGAWERCLEIGERPQLEGSMQGCGSTLARHNLDAVRTQMALYQAREELTRLVA